MKIEFEDGSFLQLEPEESYLNIIQCAKKDRKVIMSSVKLSRAHVQKLLNFLNEFMKGNNE